MFKVLILQRLYNLSDEQVEFQITDRISFCRFLELPLGGKAPDFTTVWRFRQALTDADAVKDLFDLFTSTLQGRGLITKVGTIVDASFVEVPKQRNTRQENELVKKGQTPEGWRADENKLAQKDMDARWTKKNYVSYFGYKDHVKVDAESKLITDYLVTDASVHDSRTLFDLVDHSCKGENLFCDSAYKSAEIDRKLQEMHIENYIHEKAARNRPLSEGRKILNHLKSQIRCLIEHVFGYIENSMSGPELRYIGFARNATGIGLCNLAYNMKRYIQLIRPRQSATV